MLRLLFPCGLNIPSHLQHSIYYLLPTCTTHKHTRTQSTHIQVKKFTFSHYLCNNRFSGHKHIQVPQNCCQGLQSFTFQKFEKMNTQT